MTGWTSTSRSASPRRTEITYERGLRPVHVASDWQIWDDGSLSRAIYTRWDEERPRCLSLAAEHAIGMIARSGKTFSRDVWHPLREATAHVAHRLEKAATPPDHPRNLKMTASEGWPGVAELVRHDYTLPGGATSLWLVIGAEHPIDGGGEDTDYLYDVHLYEEDARASYQAALTKYVG
ncbi:hypothetical protein [Nonomuraea salmonea]|uniref:hypothetical protein n=1 Tax=Nonomuraea salmonea TaxID=46181 RepID=UPI0031EC1AC2